MQKFKSKYRIESTRLKNWNYSTPGFYFITICTRDREHFFGEIRNGEMLLNEIGKIASDCWTEIPVHFPNAELGNFVIMPNHVHGIIIMHAMSQKENRSGQNAGTAHTLSLTTRQQCNGQLPTHFHFRFRNQGRDTVSAMVGSFKSAVTKTVHQLDAMTDDYRRDRACPVSTLQIAAKKFAWQPRFYDHIIQSNDEYAHISSYIENNATNWKDDRFYN